VFDVLMLGLLVAGFAAAIGYVHVCVNVTQPVSGPGNKPGTKQ
jgi:hypothetical protein